MQHPYVQGQQAQQPFNPYAAYQQPMVFGQFQGFQGQNPPYGQGNLQWGKNQVPYGQNPPLWGQNPYQQGWVPSVGPTY